MKKRIRVLLYLLWLPFCISAQAPVFQNCLELYEELSKIKSCSERQYFEFKRDLKEALAYDIPSSGLIVQYEIMKDGKVKLLSNFDAQPYISDTLLSHLQKMASLLQPDTRHGKFKIAISGGANEESIAFGAAQKAIQVATKSIEDITQFPVPDNCGSDDPRVQRTCFYNIYDQLMWEFLDSLKFHIHESFKAKFHIINGELASVEYLEPPLRPAIIQPLISNFRNALAEKFKPKDWKKSEDFYFIGGLNTIDIAYFYNTGFKIDTSVILQHYEHKLDLLKTRNDTVGFKHTLLGSARYLRQNTFSVLNERSEEDFKFIGLRRKDYKLFNGKYYKIPEKASGHSSPGNNTNKLAVLAPQLDEPCDTEANNHWQGQHDCVLHHFYKKFLEKFKIPELAKQMGLMGKALIFFTIDKNGKAKNIRLILDADPVYMEAITRALSDIDDLPGPFTFAGEPVEHQLYLRVNISLR